jgi:lipid-A-disaccharide synthase
MKYYIIAGEASGDLHASNLMKALKSLDTNATFRCWGGEKMEAVGGTLAEHYKNTAFMGFIEVIKNLRTILGFIKKCKVDILHTQPDVIILVDYPGFNLRIAQWAHQQGFKIVYYITPQVWAWHQSRVHDLGKYTDKLLTILPFEKAFFQKHGYDATFVGHPLLDAIAQFTPNPEFASRYQKDDNILALLPGSRKQEINYILPQMLRACRNTDSTILLAAAPSLQDEVYQTILAAEDMTDKVILIKNQTYDILSVAKYALVGSGTATLETALFKVPQVVFYKGNPISIFIAKKLVNIPFISLVNLIENKEIVKELIQNDLNLENIQNELRNLETNRNAILQNYDQLIAHLGNSGASMKAAKEIYDLISSS